MLDEGMPRQLATALKSRNIEARPFPNEWKGLTNGALLARLEDANIEVLISNDNNIYAQQNLAARKVAVVMVSSNKRSVVMANADAIADAVKTCPVGAFRKVALD